MIMHKFTNLEFNLCVGINVLSPWLTVGIVFTNSPHALILERKHTIRNAAALRKIPIKQVEIFLFVYRYC